MDNELIIKRCQSGDREAFGIFYRTYLGPMRRVVAYYVHDPDAVWDILHDGFLIAFASIDSLKNAGKAEAWLTSIMKNLALQYLKQESNRGAVPLSEAAVADGEDRDGIVVPELTMDELNEIVDRLPEGYGRVLRLAILEGLSHKEIGALLGIAPHSSSSQLARARAMMRNMIMKYRNEIGVLSVAAIILFVWHGLSRHRGDAPAKPVISRNTGKAIPEAADKSRENGATAETGKNSTDDDADMPYRQAKANIAGTTAGMDRNPVSSVTVGGEPVSREPVSSVSVSKVPIGSVTVGGEPVAVGDRETDNDSVADDARRPVPEIMGGSGFMARTDLPRKLRAKMSGWSMSLAYSGYSGQDDLSRYRIPDPSIPDVEGPAGEIEVTERTHHYMPLVIGLSVNKSITPRWSLETGIRYSLLRSDFHSESKLTERETMQRIHYIGVPLKLGYRMFSGGGFSLYGQGGVAIDIPVSGRQSVRELGPEPGSRDEGVFRVHAPLQWSAEGGIGVQYSLTPSLSIYAEPSLRYYFNPGAGIRTIRQEKPFEFTIPVGLRLTW